MTTIKILDKHIVNQIAAGEVIERPYSVVKELIENSIDAGADNISIEVKDGGRSYIKVADNGSGMSKEDARLSILRHATSKLKDLFNINTLGFRGEALSSISSVSNLKLSTNNETKGIQLDISEGNISKEQEIGMNQGTVIEVSDLFFNTPVRKKYLKSREVELSHIIDIITRYTMANKHISFRLVSDGKEIIVSPKTDNLLNKIVSIYGKDTGKNMVPVNYQDSFVKITGFIGKPYITKSDKSMQSLFINSRYVKNEIVSGAIYDAYHTLLFLNRHPVIILNLDIDFTNIDVNVHPTKDIIRIEKEEELYRSVFNAIRQTFIKNNLVPDVSLDPSTSIETRQNYLTERAKQTLLETEDSQKENIKQQKPIEVKNIIGPVLILGQLNRMYILAENPKGLLIIDQHALQERVFFERLWKQYQDKNIEQQILLKPVILELGINEKATLLNNRQYLNNLGFDIEEYGDNSFIIRKVPKIFQLFTKNQLNEIINDLKNIDRYTDNIKEEKIAVMACRKAVKAGDTLTKPEMEKLIRELESCEKPFSCPHGRPTMINISLGDLEKKFKRIA